MFFIGSVLTLYEYTIIKVCNIVVNTNSLKLYSTHIKKQADFHIKDCVLSCVEICMWVWCSILDKEAFILQAHPFFMWVWNRIKYIIQYRSISSWQVRVYDNWKKFWFVLAHTKIRSTMSCQHLYAIQVSFVAKVLNRSQTVIFLWSKSYLCRIIQILYHLLKWALWIIYNSH
jgi:hypothetical protein